MHETGLYRPGTERHDYRVPDLMFFPAASERIIKEYGIEGTPSCVIEMRSPDDETYEKLQPHFARRG